MSDLREKNRKVSYQPNNAVIEKKSSYKDINS